ncbi:hypothetical protein [Formosa algae]|uniref:hypothetical protein n=1 Tax=Formosa algae TaxID=225843 RepID=UPI000CCF509B|nr:hypothetical protein [Formosa algae]PNW27412.1 hypothetical protein BKP44_13365 [Formosa algae]
MQTGNKEFKRLVYSFSKELADGTKEYTLLDESLINENDLHTSRIRKEKRKYYSTSATKFDYYLIFRTTTNWQRCKKTGLIYCKDRNIYYGDIPTELNLKEVSKYGKPFENPTHFIVLQLCNNENIAVLDIFKNFYPFRKDARACFLKEHKLHM